jgi:hypothetical protein
MLRTLAVLTVVLTFCTGLVADDPTKPSKSKIETVSLSVFKKLDDKNYPFTGASTTLSLLVSNPDKRFLGVDQSSAVTELKDDKGTSLMKSDFFVKTSFSQIPRIALDRTSLIVTVNSPLLPAKGAKKLQLKGNLVLIAGVDEKTTDEKELEMKMNAETKAGDFTLKVTMEKGFAGSGGTFTVNSTRPNVKGVSVKDADGKTVDVSPGFNYGFGKNWTYSYSLKKALPKAKIAVTWFAKEEKVTVPVEVETGVGL